MKKDVGPAASTSRAKLSLMPRTTDDSATTTNTPTATPMIVSSARTLFARIDSSASVTPSSASRIRFMNDIARSLLTQCFDGIEQGGAPRRIHARNHSNHQPERGRGDDRPGRDRRWQVGKLPRDRLGNRDSQADADERAKGAQRRCFHEELTEDVASTRA